MEIIQAISDSITGLKREVRYFRLVIEPNLYALQLEVKHYNIVEGEKIYLPAQRQAKEFVTSNSRRMLPSADGAISLFSSDEEGWEQAIPETLFYDYLLNSKTIAYEDLIRSAILNLDSPKWNWFAE